MSAKNTSTGSGAPEEAAMMEPDGLHTPQTPQTPQRRKKELLPSSPAKETDDSELSEEEEDAIANHEVRQATIKDGEAFKPHPTDPMTIIATFRIQKPDGSGWYEQVDEIPELRAAPPTSTDASPTWVFHPSLNNAKPPRKVRQKKGRAQELWVENTTHNHWTRGSGDKLQTFKPLIIFRRFEAVTHKYEAAYVSEKKLEDVDPNNTDWVYKYNKWIDQIKRRMDSTYVKSVPRTHWTVPEIRTMYTAINIFCQRVGVPAFGFGREANLRVPDLQAIADAVNAVGNNDRNVDSVRSKITSAHDTKNKALADLRDGAAAMRTKINDNILVLKADQFPAHAIPLSEFPTVQPPTAPKARKSRSKMTATAADASAQEMSDNDRDPPTNSRVEKRKRQGDDADNEGGWKAEDGASVDGDDEWSDISTSSPPASPPKKRARLAESALARAEAFLDGYESDME